MIDSRRIEIGALAVVLGVACFVVALLIGPINLESFLRYGDVGTCIVENLDGTRFSAEQHARNRVWRTQRDGRIMWSKAMRELMRQQPQMATSAMQAGFSGFPEMPVPLLASIGGCDEMLCFNISVNHQLDGDDLNRCVPTNLKAIAPPYLDPWGLPLVPVSDFPAFASQVPELAGKNPEEDVPVGCAVENPPRYLVSLGALFRGHDTEKRLECFTTWWRPVRIVLLLAGIGLVTLGLGLFFGWKLLWLPVLFAVAYQRPMIQCYISEGGPVDDGLRISAQQHRELRERSRVLIRRLVASGQMDEATKDLLERTLLDPTTTYRK